MINELVETNGLFLEGICAIRNRSIHIKKHRDSSEAISAWVEEDHLLKGPGKALAIILNSSGCLWYLGPNGGCSMCGYSNETNPDVSKDDLIAQVKKSLNIFSKKDFNAVKIFNSGSFLNEKEVPVEAQNEIFKMINELLNVSEIIIESRPEFILSAGLKRLKKILRKDIELEIGVGLESSNDSIRIHNINKGFLFKQFKAAVDKALKENVRIKSYLLLKPPFLTEKEAIEDVVQSGLDAIKVGCRSISINPVNVQNNTLVYELWQNGLYRPPWFWSAKKAIQSIWDRVVSEGLENSVDRILCDPSGGGTTRSIHNCKKCNLLFQRALKDYSVSQDPLKLNAVKCSCYDLWLELIEQEQASLDTSISHIEDLINLLQIKY